MYLIIFSMLEYCDEVLFCIVDPKIRVAHY